MNYTTQTKPMKPWQGILFGLIFLLIGIGMIYYSVNTINSYNEKNKSYVLIKGEVVDYATNDDGLQAIIVEYKVEGKSYTKTSNTFSNMPKSIGTNVDLKYNPKGPVDTIWLNDSNNIVMPIAAGLFTLAGIFIIFSTIKKSKEQKLIDSNFSSTETLNI